MHSASARLLQTLPFSINIRKFCPTITMADPGEGPGGPGAHPPPLIFRPKWDPKGRTNFFWDRAPLISGSGWPGPPLIWRSGSATAYYQMVFLEWHSSSLKDQVFQTVIQESNFPIFFFCNTEIFLSIKYFALGFTDNVAVVVISVCV